MWEKEYPHPIVNQGSERENLHYYEGMEGATGLLLASDIQSLMGSSLKTDYIKKFKGFELIVIELTKVLHQFLLFFSYNHIILIVISNKLDSLCFVVVHFPAASWTGYRYNSQSVFFLLLCFSI